MPNHPDLPHLDKEGHVHMVDVHSKSDSRRRAIATGRLLTRKDVVQLVVEGHAPKGDVLAVARVAGIMAAKKTAEWIPLAHPLPLTSIEVDILISDESFTVTAQVQTIGKTGVEMEALTAVSATLLTIYDMLKAQDRAMTISEVRLLSKSGGRSGDFSLNGERPNADNASSRINQ